MRTQFWWLIPVIALGLLLFMGVQAAQPPERLQVTAWAVATPTFTATPTPWQYIGPTPDFEREHRP